MSDFYFRNKFLIRKASLVFILLSALFFPDDTYKYVLVGMGTGICILNLRQEFVNRNFRKQNEKETHF